MHCVQTLLRPHCIYLHIICTVFKCFFDLTVYIFILFALCTATSSASLFKSSYYMHCAPLLLRRHCIYLHIICTVFKYFFGLTVYILILYALRSTASSTSLYISSYYMHCAQMFLRPYCIYLHIMCTVLHCFFDLNAYVTGKRAVIYTHLSVIYSYYS